MASVRPDEVSAILREQLSQAKTVAELEEVGTVREGAWQISRFKGLGEMSAEQLWDTTLNPDTRRLLPVTLGEMSESDTIKTMDMLMGKAESAARRDWLEERGNEVEADI